MKKGQILEGTVIYMDFPNKGMVETEEGQVIVKNALPGQRVRLQINKKRSGRYEGRLLEILDEGPDACDSECCGNADVCGGCLYRKRRYETTLEIKKEQIHKLLDGAIGENLYEFEGILPSPSVTHYRNKMEYSFGDAYKDGPLALGFHKRNSTYDIVNTDGCRLASEAMELIRKATLDFFSDKGIPFYHKMTHIGYLRHLLVRHTAAYNEIMVALVTSDQTDLLSNAGYEEQDLMRQYCDCIRNCIPADSLGKIMGILHMTNSSVADVVRSEQTDILYGNAEIKEKLFDLEFQITPFSFFQTNSKGAEVLYGKVREYVTESFKVEGDGTTIFDLYSGTGTIAQVIAPVADHVIGVEIVEEAVAAAALNAEKNGLGDKCSFIAGDVLKTIDEIAEKPDYIILDPPREGIHPKALPKILEYGVDHIVYISCKPTSLAEDLQTFFAYGYRVEKVCAVDMFPWAGHVETCCLLVRENAHDDEMVSIKVDLEGISLNQGKFVPDEKPTYGNIKKWVKENYGFNVTSLYIGQIKDKAGIKERQNYNIGSGEGRVPNCPPEKEEAIMAAFRHFGLV